MTEERDDHDEVGSGIATQFDFCKLCVLAILGLEAGTSAGLL